MNKRLIPLLTDEEIKQAIKKDYPRAYYQLIAKLEQQTKQAKEALKQKQVEVDNLNMAIEEIKRNPIDAKSFAAAVAHLPTQPRPGRTYETVQVDDFDFIPATITRLDSPITQFKRNVAIRYTFAWVNNKWVFNL